MATSSALNLGGRVHKTESMREGAEVRSTRCVLSPLPLPFLYAQTWGHPLPTTVSTGEKQTLHSLHCVCMRREGRRKDVPSAGSSGCEGLLSCFKTHPPA